MKATGIIRRIDDLGRVVIPKEIRRTCRIREGDALEIYTLDELCQMIYEGEVQDSKTVAAIMAYSNKIKG